MISETFNKQVYVDLRPLDKGMDRETPSHFLPKGFFLTLKNTHLKPGGLFRRGGYCSMNRGSLPSLDRKVYGSPLYFGEFGETEALLVTKKHLWRIEEDGISETYVLLNELIQDKLMATVERVDQLFYGFAVLDEEVPFGEYEYARERPLPGDTVWFGKEPYEIVNVANETIEIQGQEFSGFVVVFRDHIGDFQEKTYYGVKFYKAFRQTPDWASYSNNFVFTDNSQRGLQVYKGQTAGQSPVTETLNPSQDPQLLEVDTVAYFADRLWIAAMTEDARDERFRIRWSSLILDPTITPTFGIADFIDLPIGRAPILRLLPLGNLIVAYLGDRIFYGRPTNIVGLPYDFTALDTGNVGLVGPRAVTNWLDAHWFVGQDNIYSLSATRALEPIGTVVMKDTIQNRNYDLEKTIVTADPINERIVFQFFDRSSQVVTDLWSYYYKTQGWAIEQGPFRNGDFTVRGFFFGRTISTLTWEDLEGILWEDPDLFRPWISYEPVESPEKNFILKDDGEVYLYTEGGKYDSYFQAPSPEEEALIPDVVIADSMVLGDLFGEKIERNIPVFIESGDIDFGTPNVVKTITQMSVKMEEAVSRDVFFDVRLSSNRGGRKKDVGRMRVRAGTDEGKVDFRMSGSLFRFELESSSRAEPWILSEVVLLAQEVGRENRFQ